MTNGSNTVSPPGSIVRDVSAESDDDGIDADAVSKRRRFLKNAIAVGATVTCAPVFRCARAANAQSGKPSPSNGGSGEATGFAGDRTSSSKLTALGWPIQIDGPAEAPPILLLHGWPDDLTLWDTLVAELAPRYRCIRLTWPGFAADASLVLPTFAEINSGIGTVLDQTVGHKAVTLIAHDWGCAFGYHYAMTHPERVARVVGMDIGDARSPEHERSLSTIARLGVVAYQWPLQYAFSQARAGRVSMGDAMARSVARLVGVPGDPTRVRARMGWPYWLRFNGGLEGMRGLLPSAQMPMLFLYGRRKPFNFHSETWAKQVAAIPGCEVHGLDGGHWVMLGATQEETQRIVLRWLGSVE